MILNLACLLIFVVIMPKKLFVGIICVFVRSVSPKSTYLCFCPMPGKTDSIGIVLTEIQDLQFLERPRWFKHGHDISALKELTRFQFTTIYSPLSSQLILEGSSVRLPTLHRSSFTFSLTSHKAIKTKVRICQALQIISKQKSFHAAYAIHAFERKSPCNVGIGFSQVFSTFMKKYIYIFVYIHSF